MEHIMNQYLIRAIKSELFFIGCMTNSDTSDCFSVVQDSQSDTAWCRVLWSVTFDDHNDDYFCCGDTDLSFDGKTSHHHYCGSSPLQLHQRCSQSTRKNTNLTWFTTADLGLLLFQEKVGMISPANRLKRKSLLYSFFWIIRVVYDSVFPRE